MIKISLNKNMFKYLTSQQAILSSRVHSNASHSPQEKTDHVLHFPSPSLPSQLPRLIRGWIKPMYSLPFFCPPLSLHHIYSVAPMLARMLFVIVIVMI